MSIEDHDDLAALTEAGAQIEIGNDFAWVRIGRLPLKMAVQMAHDLTLGLDSSADGLAQYTGEHFTLDRCLNEAEARIAHHDEIVFGETRPSDRNMAVSVCAEVDAYTLAADIRNDFEVHPELGGSRILRREFLKVVENLPEDI